jgi:hypothetical protein
MSLTPCPPLVVASVDAVGEKITLDGEPPGAAEQTVVIERSDTGAAAFRIASREGSCLGVRGADMVLGVGVVGSYDTGRMTVSTVTPLLKLCTPGPHARGAWLFCDGWREPIRFRAQSDFRSHGQGTPTIHLVLERQPERPPRAGQRFRILGVGPGDMARIGSFACLESVGKDRYRLSMSAPVRLSLPGQSDDRVWARQEGSWQDSGTPASALLSSPSGLPVELAIARDRPA